MRIIKDISEPSDFLKFTSESISFTYLRIELTRIRVGMTDFLIRVGAAKSNTFITIRGGKKLGSKQENLALAKLIAKEFQSKKDESHTWDKTDVEHLANMMFPTLKFFTGNSHISQLKFSTEALK